MNIEINVENISKEERILQNYNNFVEQIFVFCSQVIDVSLGCIEKIIVTDEINYGSEIDKLKPDEKFTNNVISISVAKTISNKPQNGQIKSSIIIKLLTFQDILFELSKNSIISEWNIQSQLSLYIVSHELGHCFDNNYRKQSELFDIYAHNIFKIRRVAQYYLQILLSEFAACVKSGRIVTKDLYLYLLDQTIISATDSLKEVYSEKNSYDGDINKLPHLAFSSSGTIWFILIQYAKLKGSIIGNEELSNLPITFWENAGDKVNEIMSKFFKELYDLWGNYPNWDDNLFNGGILDHWYYLSYELGFNFVEGDEFDGIYFDID